MYFRNDIIHLQTIVQKKALLSNKSDKEGLFFAEKRYQIRIDFHSRKDYSLLKMIQ